MMVVIVVKVTIDDGEDTRKGDEKMMMKVVVSET